MKGKAYADYLRDKAINELSRHLVKIDSCHDSGGSFNYKTFTCMK